MKKELIRKFVEKLDYSYNYKTVNERHNIINDICDIAGIEQLTIPVVIVPFVPFVCHDCDRPTKEYRDNLCEPCHKWHTDS